MLNLKRLLVAGTTLGTLHLLTASGAAQEAGANSQDSVQRGKYLTHHVAMCVICHSPKSRQGEIIERSKFQGGRIPVDAPSSGEAWAFRAPALVGGGARTREGLIKLLMTGEDLRGWSPKPPMPPFRLKLDDAQAVVDYLMSLD